MRAVRVSRWPSALTLVVAGIAGAALWAVISLLRTPGEVTLTEGGLRVAATFLSRAFTPALAYETPVVSGTAPLLWKALAAAKTTVTFAAAAMSLALAGGVVLAVLGAPAWWGHDRPAAAGTRRGLRVSTVISTLTRVVMGVLRSVHELLWAVLLLAALGVGYLAAVLAIAIPYAAFLGKVFSELIHEAPPETARALRETGASPLQAFLFGVLPRVLPDMTAYAVYRFECAVRSSAVLGFFGFPTLGYYIAASFENVQYGEVWTYLYFLFALVAILDWWSGALRRRLA